MNGEEMDPARRRLCNRLRRIEGQARGLQRMLAEERSGDDIVTQVAAMRQAINRVGVEIVRLYLEECLDRNQAGRAGELRCHLRLLERLF